MAGMVLGDLLIVCISRQKEFGSEEDVSDKHMKYDTLEALSSFTISLRRTFTSSNYDNSQTL